MKVKNHCLSLLVLISGCASMTIPDTEVCAVAGSLTRGMICSTTITAKERDLNFPETLFFLQADRATNKGAALCQSSKDWTRVKTALQQACLLLGRKCKRELQEVVASFSTSIEKLNASANTFSKNDSY